MWTEASIGLIVLALLLWAGNNLLIRYHRWKTLRYLRATIARSQALSWDTEMQKRRKR